MVEEGENGSDEGQTVLHPYRGEQPHGTTDEFGANPLVPLHIEVLLKAGQEEVGLDVLW